VRFFAALLLQASCCPLRAAADYLFISLAGDRRIAVYAADPKDGALRHRADVAVDGEPGAVTVDPSHHFLIASIRSEGELAAFPIGPTGRLTLLNTVPAGADPAYLSTDKRGHYLLCAYDVAGKMTVHAIAADGSPGREPRQEVSTADEAHAVALLRLGGGDPAATPPPDPAREGARPARPQHGGHSRGGPGAVHGRRARPGGRQARDVRLVARPGVAAGRGRGALRRQAARRLRPGPHPSRRLHARLRLRRAAVGADDPGKPVQDGR
jgi:hypothetical protein